MRGAPSGSLERKVSRPRLRGRVADTNVVKFSSGGLKRPWCTNDTGPQVNWTFGTSLVMPFVAVPALAAFGPVAVFSVSAFLIVVLCLDVGLLGPRSTGLRLEEVQQIGS
jgi:hypothetical protein